MESIESNARRTERYEYHDGRVARIECLAPSKPAEIFTVSYDANGKLRAIHRRREGTRNSARVYRAPGPGESLGELLPRIAATIVTAVPAALKSLRVTEQVYALVIEYESRNPVSLLPSLAVGLVADGARARDHFGDRGRGFMWSPRLMRRWGDTGLQNALRGQREICDLASQQLAIEGRLDSLGELMSGVAAELAEHDWQGILPVTRDFVVYACDSAWGDPAKAVEAAVPEEIQVRLRQAGLL